MGLRAGLSKTAMKGGYPVVCVDCYACGWWNSAAKGAFQKVDPDTFRANAKPRHRLHTRRVTHTLPDGSTRLVTEEIAVDDDEDDIWGPGLATAPAVAATDGSGD